MYVYLTKELQNIRGKTDRTERKNRQKLIQLDTSIFLSVINRTKKITGKNIEALKQHHH